MYKNNQDSELINDINNRLEFINLSKKYKQSLGQEIIGSISILDINYKGHSNNMSSSKRFLLGSMVNLSAIFSSCCMR